MQQVKNAMAATMAVAIAVASCKKSDNTASEPSSDVVLKNYSATPALLNTKPGFESVKAYGLISSEDNFAGYRFAGSADGIGLVKAQDGNGFVLMVNNEDNYSVSKITLDKTFKPVWGTYALNSDGGTWRLCSGTMVKPAEHGFGPLYISVGESSVEAQAHGLNPLANYYTPGAASPLAGLGHWSGENAVPLQKDAYPGKTVILMGEDASDLTGGQVVLYKSNTVGDLENGEEFVLRRTDMNQKETDMAAGTEYAVEFVKVDNHKTLTGAQIQTAADGLKVIRFGRVEDVDYRKGSGANAREIYFTVTGQDKTGVNADGSRTVNGRIYKLVLDAADATKGKLTCILDGDDVNSPAKTFQNPDNICVTSNYVYIQEDANGYGTEKHDAYIYQYNIGTKELKVVCELDHHRTAPDAAKYNVGGLSAFGDWEYGGLIDVSDETGIANTFLLAVQPHTWNSNLFKAVDGGLRRANEKQGSQIVILQGLPR